jgi:hypothetical protein
MKRERRAAVPLTALLIAGIFAFEGVLPALRR